MNSNDRIALELGRAQIGRLIAESQLESALATIRTLESRVAEPTPDEPKPDPARP